MRWPCRTGCAGCELGRRSSSGMSMCERATRTRESTGGPTRSPGAVLAVDDRQAAAAHRLGAGALTGDAARALPLHGAPAEHEGRPPARRRGAGRAASTVSNPPPPDEPAVVAAAGVVLISRAVFAAAATPRVRVVVGARPGVGRRSGRRASMPGRPPPVAESWSSAPRSPRAPRPSCPARPARTRPAPRCATRTATPRSAGGTCPWSRPRGFRQHWSSSDAAHV